MKKVIKMNTGNKYLSLGNLFYYIKMFSNSKSSILQSDVFCSLFNIDYINNTTVNNYLIGIRAIGMDYKKIIVDLNNKYKKNNMVFIKSVNSLISLLDDYIYVVDNNTLYNINNNSNLNKLCNKLILLSNEDNNVNDNYRNTIKKYYDENNLYDCFINIFFYTVILNKQPVFEDDVKIILDNSMKEYLKIKLFEGVNTITHMRELAKTGNVYANIEMGSLEFNGYVTGIIDYKKSYDYYCEAAKKNNPKAFYMVAYLIINKKVRGNINFAWKYLILAVKFGSVAAINTMGLCYLDGNNPDKIKDPIKALELFKESSSNGYSFAYNNLGKYYEKKDYIKSFNYYKESADLNNSWALNKVGEFYRIQNDMDKAFYYYMESSLCPTKEVCYYSFYNLAKYYYLNGNKELKIKKDINKAKDYFIISLKNGIKEAEKELKKLELS